MNTLKQKTTQKQKPEEEATLTASCTAPPVASTNQPTPNTRLLNATANATVETGDICAPSTSKSVTHPKLSGARRRKLKALLTQGKTREEALKLATKPASEVNKRHRSDGSTPEGTEGKRQKTTETRPIPPKGALKMTFRDAMVGISVAIMPKKFPDMLLETSQMDLIQEEILEKIAKEKNEAFKPQFTGSTYKAGYLVLTCENELVSDWVKKAITTIVPWEGAELWATEEDKMPHPNILIARLPNSSGLKTEKIMDLIQGQNTGLNTHVWRTLRRLDQSTNVLIIWATDQESINTLEKNEMWIHYRFGKLQLKQKKAKTEPNKTNAPDGPTENEGTSLNPENPYNPEADGISQSIEDMLLNSENEEDTRPK